MKVAVAQFAVAKDWSANLATCRGLIAQAAAEGAEILVLPEGILARDITDKAIVVNSAQPLDGPFMEGLLACTMDFGLTVFGCIHVPAEGDRVFNVQFAIRSGAVIAQYRKLHLYDAFADRESEMVQPGDALPGVVEVAGMKIGMMTCYDLRFPEVARRLAVDGAEAIVLPAAWVRGANKEAHWEVLTRARALENTCYLLAAGECGPRNIGASKVVDPLGVIVAQAGEEPALVFANIDQDRLSRVRRKLPVLANRRFAAPDLAAPRVEPAPDPFPGKRR